MDEIMMFFLIRASPNEDYWKVNQIFCLIFREYFSDTDIPSLIEWVVGIVL